MVVIEPLSVIKDFKIGNTRVKISDDFCKDKTPEDVEKILRRIAKNSIDNFNAVATNKCYG